MFSLSKLLFLVAVVAAVWFGFRWYKRLEATGALKRSRPTDRIAPQDTVRCRCCGVYVTRGAERCPRPDCPDPGRG